jgi:hypothetical protein
MTISANNGRLMLEKHRSFSISPIPLYRPPSYRYFKYKRGHSAGYPPAHLYNAKFSRAACANRGASRLRCKRPSAKERYQVAKCSRVILAALLAPMLLTNRTGHTDASRVTLAA